MGTSGEDRLRFRFTKDKGKISDLVVQYEILINGHWRPVVRYDCAHGFFHRDIISCDGSKVKKAIDVPDLNYALLFARQDIEDKWEWYKEQFLKSIKYDK